MRSEQEPKREISDLAKRVSAISNLEQLESEGIHTDSLIKTIDPTQRGIFSKEVKKIHRKNKSRGR